ncbi:helix-turn-helix transcriptional regulator [Nocardiopsis sp. JB363]|uniref:helix-turn-helix domain-containing protein n=1 Tax=Nocardiopsis sp. JB363 TaxID=1434837 RepID=UPI00097A7EE9|nr:helix-turn-helix transcriptional regulator [Nocardiopsis sp. JB363]SIO88983.1 Putative DNA-binding protein in cluster with Type I restriction-modification system [Nocardiopsis sp. JB363]
MPKRKPTLRAQWLGKMLRELREQNGLKLTDAAEYLQRSFSAISKFESGALPVREPEVLALMDLYGVEGEQQRSALLKLANEISKTGWWEKYSSEVADWFVDYMWLESRAERIQAFDVTPINGLVQTPAYAEALFRAANPHDSPAQIERGVELRMSRQKILEGENAVQLEIVMEEAALRRIVGGRTVMRDQYRHLLNRVERPNIEIRVVPFEAGALVSPNGGFMLLHMSDPFSLIAYAVSPAGGFYMESDDALRQANSYDRLREMSLDPEDSVAFIAALERNL